MYCDWPDLGRCCFCLPLRRGLIGLAYLNLVCNLSLIVIFASILHTDGHDISLIMFVTRYSLSLEVSITIYCIEVVFGCVLLYGAHAKSARFVRVYYYFAIPTTVAAVLMQILELCFTRSTPAMMETLLYSFCSSFMQLYMIILIRSLLKRLERSGPLVYENQLQQIVSGEARIDSNGTSNNTTVLQGEV